MPRIIKATETEAVNRPVQAVDYLRAQAVGYLPAPAVDFRPAPAVDFRPALVVGYRPVQAADFRPALAVGYRPVQAVDYLRVQAADYLPAPAADFRPAPAVDSRPGLASHPTSRSLGATHTDLSNKTRGRGQVAHEKYFYWTLSRTTNASVSVELRRRTSSPPSFRECVRGLWVSARLGAVCLLRATRSGTPQR